MSVSEPSLEEAERQHNAEHRHRLKHCRVHHHISTSVAAMNSAITMTKAPMIFELSSSRRDTVDAIVDATAPEDGREHVLARARAPSTNDAGLRHW
jgi:hypothetical protein